MDLGVVSSSSAMLCLYTYSYAPVFRIVVMGIVSRAREGSFVSPLNRKLSKYLLVLKKFPCAL